MIRVMMIIKARSVISSGSTKARHRASAAGRQPRGLVRGRGEQYAGLAIAPDTVLGFKRYMIRAIDCCFRAIEQHS